MSWLSKALGAMLLFAPVPFVIPFFLKNYEMRAETTMAFWILGSAIGIFFWIHSTGISDRVLPRLPEISVILLGFIFGSVANTLLGQSIAMAPNPAIPMAIAGASSMVAFLMAPVMTRISPEHFPQFEFDWHKLLGVVLVVTGIALVGWKR